MNKHKSELCLFSFFLFFFVFLIKKPLSLVFPLLPLILLTASLLLFLGCLFLPFSKGKKDNRPRETYAPKKFAQSAILTFILITIFIFSAVILNLKNISTQFDITHRRLNSLTAPTLDFLRTLDKPVQIVCVPSQNPADNYCGKNENLIKLYAQASPLILNSGTLDFSNKALMENLQASGFARYVLMTPDNRRELAGDLDENRLTNAIINLVRLKKTVYFLSGSGEPSLNATSPDRRSYAHIAGLLKERAYESKEWDLKQGDLPADAKVLVAGDNTLPYGSETQQMLRNFIARGGRLVFILNPYREQGLESLFADLGVQLDPLFLTLDRTTAIGQEIEKQKQWQNPVIVSSFQQSSEITRAIVNTYGAKAMMLVDGARPLTLLSKSALPYVTLNAVPLMFSYSALAKHISVEERNRIDINAPLVFDGPHTAEEQKDWVLAADISIKNASRFATDDKTKNSGQKNGEQDASEVVIYGFSLVSLQEKLVSISEELLPLTVAHLYQDEQFVSIPNRDLQPKPIRLSLYPSAWLLPFAGILPALTAIIGLFVWMKRRKT